MFVHSVKVPRSYKLAANIVRQVREDGANLKTLLYQDKNKHFPLKTIHALVVETIKHDNHLSELLEKTNLLANENRFDPWLAKVLITELLWGKQKLTGESKPIKTIWQYHKQFLTLLESLENNIKEVEIKKDLLKPRYIRINTLLTTAADAVRYFQDEGWNLVRCTSGSYSDFLKQVENLGQYDFLPDYHIKVVFVFAPNTQFYDCQLYQNNEIFLQDKATCLAGYLLAPTAGSTVLDMCAAPGMKTTHLAAIMKNEGTIYAVEQDLERYKMLSEFIEKSGATCVKPLHRDAVTVNKVDCPNVDYILLDPSCSGSGMRRVEDNDIINDRESGRLDKLSAFQAKLLRHALNEYRTAKRIVYSTCSVYPEENENVVKDVVRNHKGKFKLVSARDRLKGWKNIGDLCFYNVGENCIYARPESDYTSGFFVAVFELSEDENNCETNIDDSDEICQGKEMHKRNNNLNISMENSHKEDTNILLDCENALEKVTKKKSPKYENGKHGITTDDSGENIEDLCSDDSENSSNDPMDNKAQGKSVLDPKISSTNVLFEHNSSKILKRTEVSVVCDENPKYIHNEKSEVCNIDEKNIVISMIHKKDKYNEIAVGHFDTNKNFRKENSSRKNENVSESGYRQENNVDATKIKKQKLKALKETELTKDSKTVLPVGEYEFSNKVDETIKIKKRKHKGLEETELTKDSKTVLPVGEYEFSNKVDETLKIKKRKSKGLEETELSKGSKKMLPAGECEFSKKHKKELISAVISIEDDVVLLSNSHVENHPIKSKKNKHKNKQKSFVSEKIGIASIEDAKPSKSDKKKKRSVISESVDLTGDNEEVVEPIKITKTDTKKKQLGINEINNSEDCVIVEDIEKSKKKSKKKESDEGPVENTLESMCQNDLENDNNKLKKEKRKYKSTTKSLKNIDSICDSKQLETTLMNCNDSSLDAEKLIKEKKKKKKRKTNEDNIECVLESMSQSIVDTENTTKKSQKKKREHDSIEDSEDPVYVPTDCHDTIMKKKKSNKSC